MYKIIPLFATPVCLFDLNIDNKQQTTIDRLLKTIKYRTLEDCNASISKEVHLFDMQPKLNFLKQEILRHISFFNEEVMQHKKTNFKLTTSWASKCLKNQESTSHKHCNSMYSAVYYNKNNDQSSSIVFNNDNWNRHNYEIEVIKYNEYNSSKWFIPPKDKLLIVFPSFLYHKISKNLSNITRYSIACNFIPLPPYGIGDNYVK
jgi:uncharacterized protein (TIGR02466 family)